MINKKRPKIRPKTAEKLQNIQIKKIMNSKYNNFLINQDSQTLTQEFVNLIRISNCNDETVFRVEDESEEFGEDIRQNNDKFIMLLKALDYKFKRIEIIDIKKDDEGKIYIKHITNVFHLGLKSKNNLLAFIY